MGPPALKPGKAALIGAALLLLPLLAASGVQAWRLRQALQQGRLAAARSHRYEQRPTQPRLRVLLLGDSTGVGVGAPPEQTLAARLARDCGADA